jgi:ketosteroid isomerase-like protein
MLYRSLILGCFVVSLSACVPGTKSAGSSRVPSSSELATQEQSIRKALDDYHDDAAEADEKRYFDHFAEDAVFLGTDATERWTKAEFQVWAKPHFARGKAWTFHATRRAIHVDSAGAIAWFDEDLTTGGLGPSRGSGVLVLKNGTWLIAQYNLAITVPNDQLDAVKEMLQAAASPK